MNRMELRSSAGSTPGASHRTRREKVGSCVASVGWTCGLRTAASTSLFAREHPSRRAELRSATGGGQLNIVVFFRLLVFGACPILVNKSATTRASGHCSRVR
mmetsp:Transcript_13365/g.29000  ORF Transcript_13365/g.29000 Transcript_13365/m.29000 type:complete len:102 (-) Transcript_13365:1535-1840(-)